MIPINAYSKDRVGTLRTYSPPFIYGLWLTKWNWKWFSEWKVDALDLEMEGMLLYEL